jgi:hypothetical protein
MADSPQVLWMMDALTSPVPDATGHGFDGTMGNLVTKGDYALVTDGGKSVTLHSTGASNSISVGCNSPASGDPFSYEVWVRFTTLAGTAGVMVLSGDMGSAGANHKSFIATNTNIPTFYVYDTTSATHALAGPRAINDGQVHHIVGTFGAATQKLYVDGVLVASVGYTGTVRTGTSHKVGNSSAGNAAPDASFDACAYYYSELSAARVLAHYNAGKPPANQFAQVYADFSVGIAIPIPSKDGNTYADLAVGLPQPSRITVTKQRVAWGVTPVVPGSYVVLVGGNGYAYADVNVT